MVNTVDESCASCSWEVQIRPTLFGLASGCQTKKYETGFGLGKLRMVYKHPSPLIPSLPDLVHPCSRYTMEVLFSRSVCYPHEMRTPLVNLTPRPELKGNMWPALAAVPWQCWAAEGDGFQCSRLWRQDKLAILARHWNILPVLGLPLPPPRERLPACLTNHSIARIDNS